MADTRTAMQWQVEVGTQLRSLRLRQQLDQRELADRAGVALNAVKHLEAGTGATLGSFVRILRALGRTSWLKTLSPTVSDISLQARKSRHPRQRTSRRGAKKDV